MIETTHIWELGSVSFDVDPVIRVALNKKYGSKKSGTIYIVANTEGEALAVAKELFIRNGCTPPKVMNLHRTRLVGQALRMIP